MRVSATYTRGPSATLGYDKITLVVSAPVTDKTVDQIERGLRKAAKRHIDNGENQKMCATISKRDGNVLEVTLVAIVRSRKCIE